MNKETAKTVLIAFAATSVALAVVISGYTLAFLVLVMIAAYREQLTVTRNLNQAVNTV